MFNAFVSVTLRWIEIEPDGENCALCGDMIFMKGWRYALFAQTGEKIGEAVRECTICNSCAEATDIAKTGGSE